MFLKKWREKDKEWRYALNIANERQEKCHLCFWNCKLRYFREFWLMRKAHFVMQWFLLPWFLEIRFEIPTPSQLMSAAPPIMLQLAANLFITPSLGPASLLRSLLSQPHWWKWWCIILSWPRLTYSFEGQPIECEPLHSSGFWWLPISFDRDT